MGMLLFRAWGILLVTCITAAFHLCNQPHKYLTDICRDSRWNCRHENEAIPRYKSQYLALRGPTFANQIVSCRHENVFIPEDGMKTKVKSKVVNRRICLSLAVMPIVSGQFTTCMVEPEPQQSDRNSIRQDYDRQSQTTV